MSAFKRQIFITISGDDPKTRAEALRSLAPELLADTDRIDLSKSGHRVRLRVIITDPQRETSVRHALDYAASEVRDGIGEAGGTLWDGTHVQICML
jgi:hypothetical protein